MLHAKFDWICSMVLENFVCVFSLFCSLSPLRKERWFLFEESWNPFGRCFMLRLIEIGLVVLEKKIFKVRRSMYFCYYIIIPPWKKVWSFICTVQIVESSSCKDVFCKFDWFWRRRWKREKFTTLTTTTDKAHVLEPCRWAKHANFTHVPNVCQFSFFYYISYWKDSANRCSDVI